MNRPENTENVDKERIEAASSEAEEKLAAARERTVEIAAEYIAKGDATGWFDALYRESGGDNEKIPWADLEPNRFLQRWNEKYPLSGNDKKAIVVGCGLGDDAKFLAERGYRVTAFDISPTAIRWAKELHGNEPAIEFHVADLFDLPAEWKKSFDLVLEVYTIQPLPIEMRSQVIASIAELAAKNGEILVITRIRNEDEMPDVVPWPLSPSELKIFETLGFTQAETMEFAPESEQEAPRAAIKFVKGE